MFSHTFMHFLIVYSVSCLVAAERVDRLKTLCKKSIFMAWMCANLHSLINMLATDILCVLLLTEFKCLCALPISLTCLRGFEESIKCVLCLLFVTLHTGVYEQLCADNTWLTSFGNILTLINEKWIWDFNFYGFHELINISVFTYAGKIVLDCGVLVAIVWLALTSRSNDIHNFWRAFKNSSLLRKTFKYIFYRIPLDLQLQQAN